MLKVYFQYLPWFIIADSSQGARLDSYFFHLISQLQNGISNLSISIPVAITVASLFTIYPLTIRAHVLSPRIVPIHKTSAPQVG
ncbi:MAG: hypothetical protein PXX83_04520 [Candidatus Nitrosotalea sp.]|nr:hypothetical protein [Candidatus Nitrosotalea sp.]